MKTESSKKISGQIIGSSPQQTPEKLQFLDGIRGLMALNVVISHFVVVYFPQMYFQHHAETIGGPLSIFATSPLSILINGNIAVQFFFVLTGFLVARSSFLKKVSPVDIVTRSIKRYWRLLPIVLITTVFTYATMKLGLQYHLQINDLLLNRDFMPSYCNFEPSIPSLLVNIFVYPFIRYSHYVGPFWAIRYEFFGYILAILICLLFKEYKYRKLGYVVTAVLCFSQLSPNYVPFVFGVFVADIMYNKNPDYFETLFTIIRSNKIFTWLFLIVGLYFACCPMYFASIYSIWEIIPKIETNMLRAAGITFVLYSYLNMPKVQDFFSNRLFLFLGKFSFEVFALHWPIMLTLEAYLFSILIKTQPYSVASILAFLLTLPVIYVASYLVWILVEKRKH